MESKLNEGSLAPGDHNLTVYLSNDEGGYGAGAKTMKMHRQCIIKSGLNQWIRFIEIKAKRSLRTTNVILAVGGKNAFGLKPEIISDINELKNLEDHVYLLTLTLS